MSHCLKCPVTIIVQDGKGNESDGARGIEIRDVGQIGGSRFRRIIVGNWRIYKAAYGGGYDVVHFHDPELMLAGFLLKCRGRKVIYDVHEDLPRQIRQKHWIPGPARWPLAGIASLAEWLAGRVFDGVIGATPRIAARFPKSKTVTVQNFPHRIDCRNETSRLYNQRPFDFAYVGGISVVRGAMQMLDAVDQLPRNDVRLQLAGRIEPESLWSAIEKHGAWQRVVFRGWIEREAVRDLLGNVRAGLVVLHPERSFREAYPVKLFEYMAAGLPIIASDFPVWREIVEDAGCGILVNPLNAQEISQAMHWILENPEEAEAAGERGRNAVRDRYNWENEERKLIALYRRIIGGPNANQGRCSA